jgi:hypothetical protein
VTRLESRLRVDPLATVDTTNLVGDVEGFLQSLLAEMPPEKAGSGPGRPRVLPGVCLWAGFVVCLLRGCNSQLGLWRLLTRTGLWHFPRFQVTDQAIYARLGKAGTAPLKWLFERVSHLLHERCAPFADTALAPFAKGVFALDVTTLDPVARRLPSLRTVKSGDHALLPGKLAALFDVRLQQWKRIQHVEDPHENEKVTARDMVAGLPQGCLVLADLGYFGFAWFDHLTDQGLHWISRIRENTSYKVLHEFYRRGETCDALIWLGAYRADRAAQAVRLVQFRVGKTVFRYLTNVLDPTVLPLRDIAVLYARRWDVEMGFRTAKQHLKLHLMWSSKQEVVMQQVWGVLTIAQILMALRQEIAAKAGVGPFDVSLPLMIQYLPQFAREGIDPMAEFVEHGVRLRFIRPSTRRTIEGPEIDPTQLTPIPAGLDLNRTPRHANRKCGPR